MKKLKIGQKLIISFIIATLIASFSGIFSGFLINKADKEYSDALLHYGFIQGDIGTCMTDLAEIRRAERDIIILEDKALIDTATAELKEMEAQYDASFERILPQLATDELKADVEEIRVLAEDYTANLDELIEASIAATPEGKKLIYTTVMKDFDPKYDALYEKWQALLISIEESGDAISAKLSRSNSYTIIFNISLVVISMIIAISIGFLVARSIASPISKCAQRLSLLVKGDLNSPIPEIHTEDETGLLAESTTAIVHTLRDIIGDETYLLGEMSDGNFNVHTKIEDKYVGDFKEILMSMRKINITLSSTLGQINEAADQVSSGSDQVSSGAQALSQGTTEQASSIEELSATINEISEQINKNAANAINAREQTELTGQKLMSSNQQMQEMIVAMNDISDKSNEISRIIKTIDDIAFQTNILALNAAVEAARAGSAGKGFAVVADEVRNLAAKSAEAAKSTATLIAETVTSVENGVNMANNTATAMTGVIAGAQAVTQIVDDISIASNEQASAVSQVTLGVEQISAVVQTNSATAEESAAASEELSGQAQTLKSLVGRFKLRGDASTIASSMHLNLENNNYTSTYKTPTTASYDDSKY